MQYNNGKKMSIIKVANGWILELPKADPNTEAFQKMIPQMVKGIKDGTGDSILSGLQDHEEITAGRMPWPKVMGMVDYDVYIFTKFSEMMAFIGIAFEDEEVIE